MRRAPSGFLAILLAVLATATGACSGGENAPATARPASPAIAVRANSTSREMVWVPEHVHHALRQLAGVDDSLYPLPGETLPLFN